MLESLRIDCVELPANGSVDLSNLFDHSEVTGDVAHMRLKLALRLLAFETLGYDAGFVKVESDCSFCSFHFFYRFKLTKQETRLGHGRIKQHTRCFVGESNPARLIRHVSRWCATSLLCAGSVLPTQSAMLHGRFSRALALSLGSLVRRMKGGSYS